MGKPYTGVGTGGSWGEPGIWDYKALPRPGATVMYDALAGASYSIDMKVEEGEVVSFDDAGMVGRKVGFVRGRGMGGMMFWEASGDRVGSGSAIGRAWEGLGVGGLEGGGSANWLGYPGSGYDNLRGGMVGE